MRIEIKNAAKSFGDLALFEKWNATFTQGQVTALVGPSGSGKSTVLEIIAGYTQLDEGQVFLYEGLVARGPNPKLVSWVPQNAAVLPARSVLDNVMLGPLSAGIPRKKAVLVAEQALEQVGLSARSRDYLRVLSGGEVQRISFARALASGRPIVLADEPSASLDEKASKHLASLLDQMVTKACVIVATHDPIIIEYANKIVEIRGGHE